MVGKIRGIAHYIIIASFAVIFLPLVCHADNADVLPKGVFSIYGEPKFYFPVKERYDPDGEVEKIAADYNDTLDSSIFPSLGALETIFKGLGLVPPDFTANIGRSEVAFKYDFRITDFYLLYGVTDRLTVGVIVPHWWVKNNVNASINSSNATVGKNPFFGTSGDPFGGAPLVPRSLGGIPLSTEDVQNLLGKGLDVNGDGIPDTRGYNYKRFETWSGSGIGDIEAGFKYQYLKTSNWRLSFTGGVRFPTGEKDDPDILQDYAIGKGAYAILFRLNNDYTGIKNLLLNATIRYDLYLSDTETLRIPESVDQPITFNKEEVHRNYGDITELEASGTYTFLRGLDLSLLYKFGFSSKDSVEGSQGHIKSLEDETDYTEHIYIVGLYYSTIPLFMEKKFPVPLTASIAYRNRFAGSNNILKSQYIALGLQLYF